MQVKVMLKMKDGSEHEQTIMASDEAFGLNESEHRALIKAVEDVKG